MIYDKNNYILITDFWATIVYHHMADKRSQQHFVFHIDSNNMQRININNKMNNKILYINNMCYSPGMC